MRPYHILILCVLFDGILFSQNPIVPGSGLNDPHIHIFNDTAYVYASHDKSIENKQFIMEDWWVWSSPDLVHWKKESILKPEDTYIRRPFDGCWATDVGKRNGKYYWYFSEKNRQTGVVMGNSPIGPWNDPLGKPLLSSGLSPTDEYDVTIFEENGTHYIIFGVWEYYIAKLSDDMISLAEVPKKIIINNPQGPYGKGKTDDKPFLHKYNDIYYLSWGCFYAISDHLYGPYHYIDTVIKQESFAQGYDTPTWPNGFLQGRHGSFFEWHNQWYYAYCDISQTGNRWFRDTFISYVHYKNNGAIAPIRIDGIGVGQYQASGKIEAEDYFKAENIIKQEYENNRFMVCTTSKESSLNFPNINGIDAFSKIKFMVSSPTGGSYTIVIRKDHETGEILTKKSVMLPPSGKTFNPVTLHITQKLNVKENLYITILQNHKKSLHIDRFVFLK